jgi:D-alanyl-D-alanine carboxypeptidase
MVATRPIGGALGYGLGLLRVRTSCGDAFGHDGEIFGYTSLALTVPTKQRTVVLLANASHGAPEGALLGRFLTLGEHMLCAKESSESEVAR